MFILTFGDSILSLARSIKMFENIHTKNRRLVVKPIDLVVAVISICISIIFLITNRTASNSVLVILPIVFSFGYLFLLSPAKRFLNSKTTTIFTVCEVLRMVALVFVTGISNQYGFNTFTTDDTTLLGVATFLIAYEFIIVSTVILLYSIKHQSIVYKNKNNVSISNGEKIGILLIIISAAILYSAFPIIRSQINFLKISAATERVGSLSTNYSSTIVLLFNYVHYTFLCIFILITNWMANKYLSHKRKRYYYISLLIGLISIATIFSESRATIIYTAYAVFSCMALLFPLYRKRTLRLVLLVMILVFLGMTVYRMFIVYRYSNYLNAISRGPVVNNNYFYQFLESYLLGPQSVAAGIQLAKTQSSKFNGFTLIYDILRPCMGFNLILKNIPIDTSTTLFNTMLNRGVVRSNGYFLQITAQGYCYFGFLLAPIFLIVFILLAFYIEKKIADTKSLFNFFFLSYIHIRMSTVVLGGTMSGFITITSMILLILLFFKFIQKLMKDIIE